MAGSIAFKEWQVVCDLATALGYPMHYDNAAAIMDEILRLAQQGMSVLFISSEMSEVVRVSHLVSGPATRFAKRCGQPGTAFVEDKRAVEPSRLCYRRGAGAALGRKKANEREAIGGKPGQRQRTEQQHRIDHMRHTPNPPPIQRLQACRARHRRPALPAS